MGKSAQLELNVFVSEVSETASAPIIGVHTKPSLEETCRDDMALVRHDPWHNEGEDTIGHITPLANPEELLEVSKFIRRLLIAS